MHIANKDAVPEAISTVRARMVKGSVEWKAHRAKQRRELRAKASEVSPDNKVAASTEVVTPAAAQPGTTFALARELRDRESLEAAKLRGNCSFCDHTWRPRNPSVQTNRCPACGVRGGVSFVRMIPKRDGSLLAFDPAKSE